MRHLSRSNAFTSLAEGVLLVIFPLIGLKIGGPQTLALLIAAGSIPWIVWVLPSGYIADHFRRSSSLIVVNVARLVSVACVSALLFFEVRDAFPFVACAFITGSCEALGQVIRQSLVPELVERKEIPSSNSDLAIGAQFLGAGVGPALGGFLWSFDSMFAMVPCVIGCILGLVFSWRVPRSRAFQREGGVRPILIASIVGFGIMLRDRSLLILSLIGFFATAAWFVWQVVFAVWALDPDEFGANEAQYGLLISMMAFGGVAGGWLLKLLLAHVPIGSLLVGSLAAWLVWFGAPGVSSNPWLVCISLVVGGAAGTAWNVLSISIRQSMVDMEVLGRVTAVYRMFTRSGRPLGSAVGGWLLLVGDPSAIFVGLSGFMLVLSLATFIFVRRASIEEF